MEQRIVPNIWHGGTGAEAAEFYTRVVPDSHIVSTSFYPTEGLLDFQQPLAGQPLTFDLSLGGYRVVLINAGDDFRPTPAISLMVNFDPLFFGDDERAARAALDEMWAALSDDGEVLMPLGPYPFSPHYGWVADRYGMTWQLITTDPARDPRPFIMPSLLFSGAAQNRAGEAIARWTEVFDDAAIGVRVPFEEPSGPATAGSIMFADFTLDGQWFVAMDADSETSFDFSPGVSLSVRCADQAEIDRYWAALSRVPELEQCGWCADEFGVSWQVEPENIDELMERPGAFAQLMQMKKLEIDRF
ncbi:MAG: VOC family protein [Actinobacteria bacterium]|nr:VOC family protein [Actinomycetota bacterium]